MHLRSGEIQATERHASKTAEAKTDRRGQSEWEEGWCEKLQPQASQRRQPARTTEDDGQMKEAALLSLSSHSVLLSVSRQHAHPPVSLTALHCTALRGQVAVLIACGEYGGHRES